MKKLLQWHRFIYYRIYLFYVRYELGSNPLRLAYGSIVFVLGMNMVYMVTWDSEPVAWGCIFFLLLMMLHSFLLNYHPETMKKIEQEFKYSSTRKNQWTDRVIVVYVLASFILLLLRSGRIH